ncbi:hypothetical protein L9F63_017267 [Diploptera punctata]|uniref:Uncharacterized protein n=1 Tax=Diploptera punctata TaxID=6984 RepID=A0AAD7ZZA6_DIPPU|nr:hypothetical protein L9F63_017267 [Diploptera punctata]
MNRLIDVRCCNATPSIDIGANYPQIDQCFKDMKAKFGHTGLYLFDHYVFSNESAWQGECIFKKLNLLDTKGKINAAAATDFVKKAWKITEKNILSNITTKCPNITNGALGDEKNQTYAYNRAPMNFIICVYDSINLFCPKDNIIQGKVCTYHVKLLKSFRGQKSVTTRLNKRTSN